MNGILDSLDLNRADLIADTHRSLKNQHDMFSQALENMFTVVSDTKEAMEKDTGDPPHLFQLGSCCDRPLIFLNRSLFKSFDQRCPRDASAATQARNW